MEVNVTFNSTQFVKLGVPQVNLYSVEQYVLPNLKLNTTYYKLIGGKQLQAFRVLAIALKCNKDNYVKCNSYLIQLPNQQPKWIENYITKSDIIFTDRSDFLEYMQGNTSLNINKSEFWFSAVNYIYTLKGYDLRSNQFYHSWGMNKNTQQPMLVSSIIEYFLILEDSVEIGLKHYLEYYFNTKEECLAHYLNNFIIDDFAEEVEEIKIKVLPNKPLKKKLQVIELELDF